MLTRWQIIIGVILAGGATVVAAAEGEVGITAERFSVQAKHGDERVIIQRNQDTDHRLNEEYALTSRPCPPFCIQPMEVASEIETYGELEVLDFIEKKVSVGSGVLIDARTPDWHAQGTIPGSINVPYTDLDPRLGADDFTIGFSLEQLGVKREGEDWDFFLAKELLIWCNGPWCGQSPTAIRALLSVGYPAEKIKYYRGGMQMWEMMGLTVVPPAE